MDAKGVTFVHYLEAMIHMGFISMLRVMKHTKLLISMCLCVISGALVAAMRSPIPIEPMRSFLYGHLLQ